MAEPDTQTPPLRAPDGTFESEDERAARLAWEESRRAFGYPEGGKTNDDTASKG